VIAGENDQVEPAGMLRRNLLPYLAHADFTVIPATSSPWKHPPSLPRQSTSSGPRQDSRNQPGYPSRQGAIREAVGVLRQLRGEAAPWLCPSDAVSRYTIAVGWSVPAATKAPAALDADRSPG
jgi:hypothetical protein